MGILEHQSICHSHPPQTIPTPVLRAHVSSLHDNVDALSDAAIPKVVAEVVKATNKQKSDEPIGATHAPSHPKTQTRMPVFQTTTYLIDAQCLQPKNTEDALRQHQNDKKKPFLAGPRLEAGHPRSPELDTWDQLSCLSKCCENGLCRDCQLQSF